MTRLSWGGCGAVVARQLLWGPWGEEWGCYTVDEVLAAMAAKICGYISHTSPP